MLSLLLYKWKLEEIWIVDFIKLHSQTLERHPSHKSIILNFIIPVEFLLCCVPAHLSNETNYEPVWIFPLKWREWSNCPLLIWIDSVESNKEIILIVSTLFNKREEIFRYLQITHALWNENLTRRAVNSLEPITNETPINECWTDVWSWLIWIRISQFLQAQIISCRANQITNTPSKSLCILYN